MSRVAGRAVLHLGVFHVTVAVLEQPGDLGFLDLHASLKGLGELADEGSTLGTFLAVGHPPSNVSSVR